MIDNLEDAETAFENWVSQFKGVSGEYITRLRYAWMCAYDLGQSSKADKTVARLEGALAGARAMQKRAVNAILDERGLPDHQFNFGIDTAHAVVAQLDPTAVARGAVGAAGELEPESNTELRQLNQ